ncbi:hypothetical protein GGR56DRAFT_677422 [Xylariaceae sp. FL0804]|nr:hypothetical protein GGR56DRAFT_677422 [Xylariaceae sp. FL0804]
MIFKFICDVCFATVDTVDSEGFSPGSTRNLGGRPAGTMAASAHTSPNLAEKLKDTEKQLKDTQEQLKDTQEQLKDTEKQLKDNQERLKDTEERLKDTQVQLKDTQVQLKDIQEQFDDLERRNAALDEEFSTISTRTDDLQRTVEVFELRQAADIRELHELRRAALRMRHNDQI